MLEKAFFPAAELRLDLRVVRLPQDPADWLLENSAREFREMLSGASSVLEYVVRRNTDRVRGTDAVGRARALPKIKDLVQRIEDPILSREALRLAAEALGMDPGTLREELREESGAPNVSNVRSSREGNAPARATSRRDQRVLSDPVVEAGREVLALMLARPDLSARALREGMKAPPPWNGSVMLGTGDFGDETQGRIFALLEEYASEGDGAGHPQGLGSILSDERARPLLDEISALRAAGERLYPSTAALRAAWFRLAAIKRAEAKLLTEDFDEKYRLHTEVKLLNAAAVEASNQTLDS